MCKVQRWRERWTDTRPTKHYNHDLSKLESTLPDDSCISTWLIKAIMLLRKRFPHIFISPFDRVWIFIWTNLEPLCLMMNKRWPEKLPSFNSSELTKHGETKVFNIRRCYLEVYHQLMTYSHLLPDTDSLHKIHTTKHCTPIKSVTQPPRAMRFNNHYYNGLV